MSEEEIKNTRNNIENEFDRIFSNIYNYPESDNQEEVSDEFNQKKYDIAVKFIDELEKQFNLGEIDLERIMGGEFNSDFSGVAITNHTSKVPMFLLLDILKGLIKKTITNGSHNVLQKNKSELIKRIDALRMKASKLRFDSRFSIDDTLTEDAISKIATSAGNFKISFKKLSDYDNNFTVLLEDRNVLVLETEQRLKQTINNHTIINAYNTSNLLLNGQKKEIEEEYNTKRNNLLLSTIDEIKEFFEGVYPKTLEEAQRFLASMGYNIQTSPELFEQLKLRYEYLQNEEDILPDEGILASYVNGSKKLDNLKRNSKIKPNEEVQKRAGLFGFVKDLIQVLRSNNIDHDSFDEEREAQKLEDEKIIDEEAKKYVVEHHTADGKVVRHI